MTDVSKNFTIGLCLATTSSIFIGASFILKKISLNKLSKGNSLRASAGGFGYLKDVLWWLGLLSMGLGEATNFIAYAFAPASLVTPLGALSVLVSTVLASRFLQEHLNFRAKVGCALCVIGSTVIVIYAPRNIEANSLLEFTRMVHRPSFIYYLMCVILLTIIIMCKVGPKYGTKHVSVYIILCSAIGSISVIACKGLGLGFRELFNSDYDNVAVIALLLLALVVCICVQMTYLNKALDIFGPSLVTPIYYVMFTGLVLLASAILFKEWQSMANKDVIGSLFGFFIVIIAIFLLQSGKDINSFRYSRIDSPT